MAEVKETKAQKVERLKREKLAWDHLDEIREFARKGRDSIPPEWLGTYFRSWGIYTQGDGAGVVGGANGEGKAAECFMVRIRIPNGILTSDQARVIAGQNSVGDANAHHEKFRGFSLAVCTADHARSVALRINSPGAEICPKPFRRN